MCRKSVHFVLEQNIIHGDALTFKKVDKTNEPIVFSEWSPINSVMIKRREYIFEFLQPSESEIDATHFSDDGKKVYIPVPLRSYPVIHFLRLYEHAG